MNIFTVNCWKDENKVKEAGSSPKKETWLGMEYCSRLSGTRVSYIKKHSREWELSLYSWPPVLPVWIWSNKWADANSTWVKQLNPNKINRRSAVQWYLPSHVCSLATHSMKKKGFFALDVCGSVLKLIYHTRPILLFISFYQSAPRTW